MLSAASPRALMSQSPAPDSVDGNSIEGIVRAYYEVISGPPGTPRQWRRDSTLYMPAATFGQTIAFDNEFDGSTPTDAAYRRTSNRLAAGAA